MATPQPAILAETGPHALFLTLRIKPGTSADTTLREAAAGFPRLLEELAAGDPTARLVGTLAFGAACWRRLAETSPRGLRPFAPLGIGPLKAPATGGDLFLHLHSARADLNFLLARRFVAALGPWTEAADETHAFRYLDCRDLTGFIDGTENPEGEEERAEAALIGATDPAFEGGSYLLAQRYVHRLERWEHLAEREQEGIIGRTKADSVELEEEVKPASAHISRVVIEEQGEELEIVRHSLPYGAASGESGLFFLAYSRDRSIFDRMLGRMFGTSEDGLHDRLMEFTTPVSGAYFFAPSREMLAALNG